MAIANRCYQLMLQLANKPQALYWLAFFAFIESSIFPIPPDIMLIPMVLAARQRAWVIALVCTLSSVLGGIAGYGIGALLFESLGRPILEFYGHPDALDQWQMLYDTHGWWVVMAGGLTPIPYKLVTIASGVFELDLLPFIAASFTGRGLRFFLIAGLLFYLGPAISDFIQRRLGLLLLLGFALAVLGFLAVFTL